MGDIKITQSDKGLVLKQDTTSSYIGLLFIAFMLWKVVPEFIQLFPPEGTGDYIGIAFMALWLAVILGMAVFIVVRFMSARVELSPKGIFYSDFLRKRDILWCELKDYGISCAAGSKVGKKYYCLYFSEEVLPEKKRFKMMQKGVIKLDMNRNDYASALTKVIPYCQQYITATKPFVAE